MSAICKQCGSGDLYCAFTTVATESIDVEFDERGQPDYESAGDREADCEDDGTDHFGCRGCDEIFGSLAEGVVQDSSSFAPGDVVWLTYHHVKAVVGSVDLDAKPVRVHIEGFADWFPPRALEFLRAAA